MIKALEQIAAEGDQIVDLLIKNHGASDVIQLGTGGQSLTVAGGVVTVYEEGENQIDITDLLKKTTGPGTHITLRGCDTAPRAAQLEDALDGADVWGNLWWKALGIPWTDWAFSWEVSK